MLEQQFHTWKKYPPNVDLGHLYEVFRKHGLVLLYPAGAQDTSRFTNPDLSQDQESLIQQYAEETLDIYCDNRMYIKEMSS